MSPLSSKDNSDKNRRSPLIENHDGNQIKNLQRGGYNDKNESNKSSKDRNDSNTQSLLNINDNNITKNISQYGVNDNIENKTLLPSNDGNQLSVTRNDNNDMRSRSKLANDKDNIQSKCQTSNSINSIKKSKQIVCQKSKNLSGSEHQNTSKITNEFELKKCSNIQIYLKYKI